MPRYLFPKPYADLVARMRVPSGFLLVAAFGWWARPTVESLAAGVPVSLLGLGLRAWAAGHLEKNQKLVSSGPYRFHRNPLYAGTLVTALGLAVGAARWELAALFAAVFVLVYVPVMELEEQHLRGLFPSYAAYADRVPLLIPRFPGVENSTPFRGWLYSKNREYQALLGFLLGLAYLVWKALRA
jgi:protein-S-isoprenylcysteine O-methyltransferase Ste14